MILFLILWNVQTQKKIYKTALTLPIFNKMTDEQVKTVIDAFEEIKND